MFNQFTMTVLVSHPGSRRQCLSSLLRVIPGINQMYLADDEQEALQLIEGRNDPHTLVVFDTHFAETELEKIIQSIREKMPLVRVLLLIEQFPTQPDSSPCGAHAVLSEYFSIGEFQEAVNNLYVM